MRVMRSWNLQAVEEIFASAATDASLWSRAIQTASEQTDSIGALILPVTGQGFPSAPATEGIARATEVYFRDGWCERDIRYSPLKSLLEGNVIDDLDFISPEEMKRTPYYQEFLAPTGLRWFGGIPVRVDDQVWCLSIQRGIRQDPFSPEEKQKLKQLSRRLSSAAALARALGFAAASAALEAFDLSHTAVALLNAKGEVARTNRAADRLMAGELQVRQGRICSIDQGANDHLSRALRELLWKTSGASLLAPVMLPRKDKRPVLAYPVKMSQLSASYFAECQAAIVLVDTDARRRTPEATLRGAFHLTQAEARLASQLASGASLDTVCERLGIVKETGRNQLKSIFAKTGTSRQAELVLLIASML
jgi:DNA-binding CsgD family transcriptional regulator